MIISNYSIELFIIFILILLVWFFMLFLIKNNKKSIFFLILSFIFISISLFDIRLDSRKKNDNLEWWNTVFVVDVSKSMNVLDVKSETLKISRLAATKKYISNYIWNYIQNSYWLMIFSWEAVEVLPFTNDINIYSTILSWINSNNIAKSWTNLNSVFDALSFYFESYNWWTAIIFTDGWDEQIEISKEAIKRLEKNNVSILLVWVWTKSWWKIPDWSDLFWRIIYKTYNWEIVISKLNENILKKISKQQKLWYKKLDSISDFNSINDLITFKNTNTITNDFNKLNLTFVFIFLSFFCFIIFLLLDFKVIWKK